MAASPRVPDSVGNLKFLFSSNQEEGIVAKAGGGQTLATQLGAQTNVIATCATTSDSVKLPEIVQSPGVLSPVGASVGAIIVVANLGAANAQVFGGGTDTINGVATATGVSLPAGTSSVFVATGFTQSTGVGRWVQTTPNSVASGALVGSSLTGSAAPFPIAGLAAAQGGAVSVTGGASSTSANAGGAVSLAGGLGGATGVGGAVTMTGGAGQGGAAGGAATQTGGAGQGTGAGGASSMVGGASGAGATGNGGAVTMTGGAALSTAGNGGAAVQTGGAGAAAGTGNGGAAGMTGGASGTGATGTGGAATVTGGAALSTNGAGGAASLIGGLGTGTQAGGAVTITSGAAGATGVAGAVNIAVGAATAGNGSTMTLTAGNGAGGTNAGGNINLVPGTAVSTGAPGSIFVNGDPDLIPIVLTSIGVLEVTTRVVHVCTRAMRLTAFSSVHATASTSGTVTVEKLTGTTAPGSGTALLSGTVSLSGTANTVANGTLIATVASLTFAAGDRVGFVFAGTMTNLVGACCTALFTPV